MSVKPKDNRTGCRWVIGTVYSGPLECGAPGKGMITSNFNDHPYRVGVRTFVGCGTHLNTAERKGGYYSVERTGKAQ